jgi:hypothetical protein
MMLCATRTVHFSSVRDTAGSWKQPRCSCAPFLPSRHSNACLALAHPPCGPQRLIIVTKTFSRRPPPFSPPSLHLFDVGFYDGDDRKEGNTALRCGRQAGGLTSVTCCLYVLRVAMYSFPLQKGRRHAQSVSLSHSHFRSPFRTLSATRNSPRCAEPCVLSSPTHCSYPHQQHHCTTMFL